tara:strand:- start:4052 stop:4636 length:585 start_codon:yes stop_codon:yes gene_type:complete
MKTLTTLLFITLITAVSWHANAEDGAYENLVDGVGNITLPDDYRASWAFLGTYFVKNAPKEEDEQKAQPSFDIHSVYTQAESIAHYRKEGEFPDGAVLIKDVNATKQEKLTTGEVYYADTPKIVFAMVKDRKNRFPDNEAWAEGWGWALFKAGNPVSQTTTWKGEGFNNCFACHVPAKDQDWVFTQGYKSVLNK